MSKLINKLNRVSKTEPLPMGFKRVQASPPKPKIVLIAEAAQTGDIAESVSGADAGLVRINDLESGTKALQTANQAKADIPWGGWPKEAAGIGDIAKAGADFIVFPPAVPVGALKGEDIGKILQIEPDISEGLLITINELPVNAVLIAYEPASPLTLHDMMIFRRASRFLSKPLLVPVTVSVSGDELKALWEAGVDGVIARSAPGKIKELRQLIDSVTFPLPRKTLKREAVVPHLGEIREEEEEEGEEEEPS